jgi:hypothetical protein
MNGFTDLLSRALRGVLSLLLGLGLALLALSLLLAALVVVLGMTLWALVTGRKPAPVMVFQRFRQASQRYAGGAWAGRGPGRPAATGRDLDVVDVQAHEVPEAPASTGSARPGTDTLRRASL